MPHGGMQRCSVAWGWDRDPPGQRGGRAHTPSLEETIVINMVFP